MKDITKSKLWSEEAIESGLERDFPFLCTVAEHREALWTIDLWIAFEGKDTDYGTLMAPFRFRRNGKIRELKAGNES